MLWCWQKHVSGTVAAAGSAAVEQGAAAPPNSLLQQVVLASTSLVAEPGSRSLARQPWGQQLAAPLAAVGVQLDLADPQPVSRAAVRAGCQQHQLEQPMAAAERSSATKVQHCVFGTTCPGLALFATA